MKGIVLAGGAGTRLWPLTFGVSKQLLPVYDKPMIHYPISTLMLAHIREILIITTRDDQLAYKRSLGDGSRYGINLTFATQESPNGIVEAFKIGREFIGTESVALILGDNIFYGQGLGKQLTNFRNKQGANVFAYRVSNPESYGVVEFDSKGKALSIEEKPSLPKSKYAIPGLYFYDNTVIELAKEVKPSKRGELEISSLNQRYLEMGTLTVTVLERGTAWLDTGTFESLYAASSFIKAIEDRQGFKVACLEEIGWRNNWISDSHLLLAAKSYKDTVYSNYLWNLIENINSHRDHF